MELWQLDVMGARLRDGSAVKFLTGIADDSRFCVVAHAMPWPPPARYCEAFAQALSGLPR
jgi:hypothetical protein